MTAPTRRTEQERITLAKTTVSTTKKVTKPKSKIAKIAAPSAATNGVDIRELLKAGAHFGHKSSHWNPHMQDYIHSLRSGIYIIDLVKTTEQLKRALAFLENVASENGQVLFVGTKKHLKEVVKEAAQACGMPYVTERWMGGTLTNHDTINNRIKYLKSQEDKFASGELAQTYNKRELGDFKAEMAKLNQMFGGLKEMAKPPAALFVSDVLTDRIAAGEAIRLGIPVVAIVDTNANPEGIEYVIAANDDAVSSVKLISTLVAQAINRGKVNIKPAPKETKPTVKKSVLADVIHRPSVPAAASAKKGAETTGNKPK